MCGIIGYVGGRDAVPIIMNGLKKLEYRGYDSAGLAVMGDHGFEVRKFSGRLSVLERNVSENAPAGTAGIGHTRWATHGAPSDSNAHPHLGGRDRLPGEIVCGDFSDSNFTGEIAIVHNGIIENYQEIKEELTAAGVVFRSETDTEVLAHFIASAYRGDLTAAVREVLGRIRGSYAFVAMAKSEPDRMVCVRKENPLVIGLGRNENFAASDIPALLEHTKRVCFLGENELALVQQDSVTFFGPDGAFLEKEVTEIGWNADSAEKGDYPDFMLKEIREQPQAILATLSGRVSPNVRGVTLDDISLTAEDLKHIERIDIVACGTAANAGLVGKHLIENLAKIPVEVKIASEFRYNCPLVSDRTLTVAVSQSGETLDTLMSVKEAKKKGSRILGIVNVMGSSIARESDDVLLTRAGPEIAVASTKAYTAQLAALFALALRLAQLKGTLPNAALENLKRELLALPALIERVLPLEESLQRFAAAHASIRDLFFLGRGLDYASVLEGSLKLKELSYIHSEAYPAGELKHHTIALIEKGSVVLALLAQEALYEKMISNIREVKARGAYVLAITQEGHVGTASVADETIYLPKVSGLLAPLVSIVPLQLLAYHMALARGCDVDKPRNLAKSVTVE